ncbi:MAG: hypothetical protein ACLU0O_02780 [Collinsella sp.]
MLGQNLIEKWPQKKVDYLRHTFLLFKRAYLRAGGHLDITPADAMLVYLNVYNQDRLLDTPTDIVVKRLCKIWREMVIAGKSDEEKVDLVEAPSVDEEETPAKSTSGVLNFFMGKTVYSAANPLRIAFIHEFPCATSSWDSLYDQGRQYLDEHFGGIVRTEAFEDCHDPDVFYAAVETAVKHGAKAIFSTSHRLMEYTLRAAVEYPRCDSSTALSAFPTKACARILERCTRPSSSWRPCRQHGGQPPHWLPRVGLCVGRT